jgi:hypothetical protein
MTKILGFLATILASEAIREGESSTRNVRIVRVTKPSSFGAGRAVFSVFVL